ncbi:arsenate reductase [Shewanella hanedai]|uniref:ArsC family reductase n=1 Tax=Shewanella hanedai TaxID=25 RepID=A0A553JNA3_SHEHA|nr:ArsC family reductase [Shewanella hanedai]TRY13890.1 ArsC family reductase [Shewanella hanedai]GGI86134.1 arsenate reductase [Shewanella hanedai]
MTLFGIKNCDTVKKARKWTEANDLNIPFHDFRVDGLTKEQIETWAGAIGWETLFNKRSTSFRNLSDDDKAGIDQAKAVELMLTHPTLIKRPVLATDGKVLVGFKEAEYKAWFKL